MPQEYILYIYKQHTIHADATHNIIRYNMQYGAPQFAAVPNYAPLQQASTNSYTMQTQVYRRYI